MCISLIESAIEASSGTRSNNDTNDDDEEEEDDETLMAAPARVVDHNKQHIKEKSIVNRKVVSTIWLSEDIPLTFRYATIAVSDRLNHCTNI